SIDSPNCSPVPNAEVKISARYEVASTTWVMPHSAARANWCARKGTPAVGSNGLGADRVSGLSRVPLPPTSRIASSGSRGISCVTLAVGSMDSGGRRLPRQLVQHTHHTLVLPQDTEEFAAVALSSAGVFRYQTSAPWRLSRWHSPFAARPPACSWPRARPPTPPR